MNGVKVFEGIRVLEVLFEGERAVGVKIQEEDGTQRSLMADVVVDASGQSSMIQNRLKLKINDHELRKGALWTYWEGAYRDTGRDEGATLVLATKGKEGWFWYIPLHNNIISVGIVTDFETLFGKSRGDHAAIYQQEVDKCLTVKQRIANAKQVAPFYAQKEYSYHASKVAGDGWVLIGDAFGFLDPLYSSGVLLALKSGSLAADAVAAGLKAGDTSEATLGKWGPGFKEGMDRMRRLVLEYYNGFSFGRFVKQHPELKGKLTDLLIGDLFEDEVDEVFVKLDKMQAEMAAQG